MRRALQFVNQILDHGQSFQPERRIRGVKTERCQQFGMVFGAAGFQHVEIFFLKAAFGVLIDGIERVNQTVAKRVGVDVERRVNEVRDVGPEGFVTRIELDGGARLEAWTSSQNSPI